MFRRTQGNADRHPGVGPPPNPHKHYAPAKRARARKTVGMTSNPGTQGRRVPWIKREQDDKDEALEAYLLEHVPGLRAWHEAQHRAFSQIENDAQARHPDPTPEDIAAAEAREAAMLSRKRTEVQLRRSFTPLAQHLPGVVKRTRKRFIQQGQRAWSKDNPSPLTWEIERTLIAEFKRAYAGTDCS